jgi:hypothetical protein
VIDSHTIQRKGPLERIVDDRNHVLQLQHEPGGLAVVEIGWKRASTFPGYCSEHDSGVFAPLEQQAFTGSHEQCVLLAYRNVCNELYKKRAVLEGLEYQRDHVDRGRDLDQQISRQLSILTNATGQAKSRDELVAVWNRFHRAITQRRYAEFESRCYFFTGDVSVVSSGVPHAEYSFDGTKHANLWDLRVDAEMLSHATMVTDAGGAIVFTWLAGATAPQRIVTSFDHVAGQDKGDVFVQYCFLNCENTYFSRAWWDGLDQGRKDQIRTLAGTLDYDGARSRRTVRPW